MSAEIAYAVENDLIAEEFVDVLKRSSLDQRRPVSEKSRIQAMLKYANLIVTARSRSGLLIGVSRCLTDFSFVCYCSDLAVDTEFQGRGVGKALINLSAEHAGNCAHFLLLSAPDAVGFYEKIGMVRHPACFERLDWKRFTGESDDSA